MKKNIFLLFISLTFILFSCNKATEPENKPIRELTVVEKQIANSSNTFGFNLFQKVSEKEDGNIFISPLSFSFALGMTYNGSNGETKEAMKRTLGFPDLSDLEINQSYKSLIELFTTLDEKVAFNLANSIWYRDDFSVENEFIELNKKYFNAEVSALNFMSPIAKDIINKWCEEKTKGRIKEVIDNIPDYAVMYLINAIYFKGDWQSKFDKKYTKEQDFFKNDGRSYKVKMMMKSDSNFRYFANEKFQAIDLPYSRGDYAMTVILPNQGYNLNNLIKEFNQENYNLWISSFKKRYGHLAMPKFKLDFKRSFKDILSDMGMSIAFSEGLADFSRINKSIKLFISEVLHKSFLEVNEEGTEAAAVTVVEISYTSIGDEFRMTVNRPFLLVIRETKNNTILFLGKIVEPKSE
ncbi:MAG: serpin family protein [Candidatus Kapabacteria bacterium]|nr:serpin family protein [Candidatus Kapabacteria bacterium]